MEGMWNAKPKCMWPVTGRAFTFSNTRKHQWKTKCGNPIAVVWVLASHMLLNALVDLRYGKMKEIALLCSALPKVCKHRGNLLSAKQRLLRWPKLRERHLFPGNLLHHSDGRPQSYTNESPYGSKPQGFIGLVPCMCVAWSCRVRDMYVVLSLLQVRLRQKGAFPKPGWGPEGFHSRVNGNQRANRNFSILLRNEHGGGDPVPTITASVTNAERRELFHYIMRHYIVLEKQSLMTCKGLASAFQGILFYFLKDFNPCSSCYA